MPVTRLFPTNTAVGDAPFHRAMLERTCGRLLAKTGQTTAAVKLLSAARDRFARLPAPAHVDQCQVELTRLGAAARGPGPGLVQLTERERQIAHLVGRGLTNPEIAAELFLSGKTVEYQLRHVFSKLAVSNRRQLRDRIQRARLCADPRQFAGVPGGSRGCGRPWGNRPPQLAGCQGHPGAAVAVANRSPAARRGAWGQPGGRGRLGPWGKSLVLILLRHGHMS